MCRQAGASVGRAFRQGGFGDRALGRPHDGGLRRGHVRGELPAEHVLPDGEIVAAGGDRVRGKGVGEGAAGELVDSWNADSPWSGANPATYTRRTTALLRAAASVITMPP